MLARFGGGSVQQLDDTGGAQSSEFMTLRAPSAFKRIVIEHLLYIFRQPVHGGVLRPRSGTSFAPVYHPAEGGTNAARPFVTTSTSRSRTRARKLPSAQISVRIVSPGKTGAEKRASRRRMRE